MVSWLTRGPTGPLPRSRGPTLVTTEASDDGSEQRRVGGGTLNWLSRSVVVLAWRSAAAWLACESAGLLCQ